MKIKICGIKETEHAMAACEAGADFIGLVFYAKSPRFVSYEKAADIAALAKEQGVASVALTVNADDTLLESITDKVKPDYMQFHGGEDEAHLTRIRPLINSKIIRMVAIGSPADVSLIASAKGSADLVLADAKPQAEDTLPGGNARPFDWSWLAEVDLQNCLLAGGLTEDNVGQAIATCKPWGIDVSSGVEVSYGVKSTDKIKRFIDKARTSQ